MRFFFIFFLSSTTAFAQSRVEGFISSQCAYKTDGQGKSLGLKIKVSYPCEWKMAEGERPHVLQKFTYSGASGESASENFTINKLPSIISDKDLNDIFSQEGLREISAGSGTYVSGRKVQIDGIQCAEVITKTKKIAPAATVYLYTIQYYIFYKTYSVTITFMTGGTTEASAEKSYKNYKLLFQLLATNTVILSKW